MIPPGAECPPAAQQRQQHTREYEHVRLRAQALLLAVARFEAWREIVGGRGEWRSLALEFLELLREFAVHSLDCLDQKLAVRSRSHTANHRGDHGVRPFLDPYFELADLKFFDRLSLRRVERVAHEILYSGKHARHEAWILNRNGRRDHVAEREARASVNEEDLLDAKDQAVHEHDFGKRSSSAQCFEAPLQPAQREALLHRFVE